MALITCPECGCELSEAAESCPGCGCPTSLFAQLERDLLLKSAPALREDDCFSLGVWGGRSIRWRALEAEGDRIFAISEKGLDCKSFNHTDEQGNDWDTSDLKAWLEREFLERAFTRKERARVLGVTCLSVDEAEAYFEDDEDRICRPTGYARGRGLYVDGDSGGCDWWLRSPGTFGSEYVAYVFDDGMLDEDGAPVSSSMVAVRPVLRLQLPMGRVPEPLSICPVCGKRVSKHAEQCSDCGCPQAMFSRQVGNGFTMGRWDGQAIPWRTLKVEGNRIFAISMVGLTTKPFNRYRFDDNDWDSSYLREWLDDSFPLLAFSAEERAKIREITCLTVDEAKELFEDDSDRICPPTDDASRQGVTIGVVTGGCDWWLRSPGLGGPDCATFVNFAGYIGEYGCQMDHTNVAVRPAVWVEV